jgi:hypothetical protein
MVDKVFYLLLTVLYERTSVTVVHNAVRLRNQEHGVVFIVARRVLKSIFVEVDAALCFNSRTEAQVGLNFH